MTPSVLLVDDEPAIRFSYLRYLTKSGFAVIEVSSLGEARKATAAQRFDAVLLDLNLPDGNGLDWISELRELQPDIPIVVITGVGDIPSAVEAMRRGADHFLTKPVNMTDLEVFLRKSLELGSLRRRSFAQRRLSRSAEPFFGDDPVMQQTLSFLRLAAENDSVVFLHGETGTGKGIYARWIHSQSSRSALPFVEVNCSSLRGELLSSELFGHVRGAFTSAVETRQGLLDVADGGTLFLDEIGDMDPSVQAPFLKVLEEKRYRRLGEVQERRSDFRLICATNRNLLFEAQEGRFRKDLYFRINVLPIEVPPLRTRPQDLPGLVRYLFTVLGARHVEISADSMEKLKGYPWPGNVRELRNVLERALLLARGAGQLQLQHFPGLDADPLLVPQTSGNHPPHGENEDILRETLNRFQGDKEKAARALGISRATLYRRLKSLGH